MLGAPLTTLINIKPSMAYFFHDDYQPILYFESIFTEVCS